LSAQTFAHRPHLQRLPLITLYLTDRCNSRCVTCDYWRHGRTDVTLESVRRLLPSLVQLQTQVVLLSGGEPLLNPDWAPIAELLRSQGLQVWLLTSGLSLLKHARRASALFHSITVSLDGTDAKTYAAIRGLDAFDKVCGGIKAAADHGAPPIIRVTLQRANYRQLPNFVTLAKQLGARSVSFLPVDVANPHAFGRTDDFSADLSLLEEDLSQFAERLRLLERDYAESFRSGFIAESPQKLGRILQYFTAIRGIGPYPPVRCNAPEFSAVIGASGTVQPCFFITGPPDAEVLMSHGGRGVDLPMALNSEPMTKLRADIHAGARPECKTCVCSMWRDPENIRASTYVAKFAAEATA
jgi:MoaA/NifB/PqqE/SkfB family radical SAM enzyme